MEAHPSIVFPQMVRSTLKVNTEYVAIMENVNAKMVNVKWQQCLSKNVKEVQIFEVFVKCNNVFFINLKGCYRGQNFFAHGDIYNGDCFKCPCRCPYQQGSEDNPCYFDTPNCKKKDKCSESKEKDELKEINSQN